jgi:hypothetical protein
LGIFFHKLVTLAPFNKNRPLTSTARVDENGRLLHQLELGPVEEVRRCRRQRARHDHEVGPGTNVMILKIVSPFFCENIGFFTQIT